MEILRLILCAVLAYFLGNIQTGLLVGRLANVDLRKHGSGSSGATNALRVLGSKSGALTLLGDFLKGLIAVGIGLIIAGQRGGMVASIAVVCGHIWPVLFGFHGGKGVATSIGAIVLLMPLHCLLMVVVGILVIIPTKTVSLGSIAGATVFLISGAITAISSQNWFQLIYAVLAAGLVIFAHRANIGRLVQGNENKLTSDMFKKK